MPIKIKKILKIFFISLLLVIIGFFLYGFVSTFLISKFVGFQIDTKLTDKYRYIFNKDYNNDVTLNNSNSSIFSGNIYYYLFKSKIICIIELKQFREIDLKRLNLIDRILNGEKQEYPHTLISGISQLSPQLIISFYPSGKKYKNVSLYMRNEIVNKIQKLNYYYLKFIGNRFSISSNDEYPDFTCLLTNENKQPMELLIKKEKDKTLFILKYQGKNAEDENNNISLLDLINLE